ncbi:hypothetical protein DL98DRAFT_524918 [Cadophora sp. DSE1049]|nr:hypothetical protein DL98DRAFT_524918 [Cadophora sp. DSE1049]
MTWDFNVQNGFGEEVLNMLMNSFLASPHPREEGATSRGSATSKNHEGKFRRTCTNIETTNETSRQIAHAIMADSTITTPAMACFTEKNRRNRLTTSNDPAWHPRVIAVKDDFNPFNMALSGGTARYPLVRVNKEAREEVRKTKINFNAEYQINGAPKILANLAVHTIWIMNWKRSSRMIPSSSTTWNKWKGCPLASMKKVALCSHLVSGFFEITAENRSDDLQIGELFVLSGAQDGVLDVDTIQLIEPQRDHRQAIHFSSRSAGMRRKIALTAEQFWEKKAEAWEKEIEGIKIYSQTMFEKKTNGTVCKVQDLS